MGNFCWCILVGTVLHFVEGIFLMYIFVFDNNKEKNQNSHEEDIFNMCKLVYTCIICFVWKMMK